MTPLTRRALRALFDLSRENGFHYFHLALIAERVQWPATDVLAALRHEDLGELLRFRGDDAVCIPADTEDMLKGFLEHAEIEARRTADDDTLCQIGPRTPEEDYRLLQLFQARFVTPVRERIVGELNNDVTQARFATEVRDAMQAATGDRSFLFTLSTGSVITGARLTIIGETEIVIEPCPS